MTRGMEIVEMGKISENADGSFGVPSQTGNGNLYRVEVVHGHWVCSCPDFEYRHIKACKHIYAIQFSIALKQYTQPEAPEVVAADAVSCKFCGSIRVMRYGLKNGKQQYKCKDCQRAFIPDNGFKKIKYDPELITITLDLYFKGISLRKISDHILQTYGLEVNFSTLYRWIAKYISAMDAYVKTLTPNLSGKWHVDEMVIKSKGGIKMKGSGQYKYLWNVLDNESRFQLASEISKTRNELDAMNVFKQAREIAKAIPSNITSDKLGAYPMGVERAFIDVKQENRPKHNRVLSGACTNGEGNQLAERLHNTIRERNKVQRGWKKDNTPLRNGQMIYYNYVRPHMTLEGKTPAEVAGLPKETWKSLLRKSLNKPMR